MNHIVLTLLEATLTLYPADANDQPVLAAPVWTGVAAENLVIRDQWIKLALRPTGRRYPRNHPLVAQYEISAARVWALPIADLAGFTSARGRYVLDVVWKEEETNQWHRETFYGVTISDRSRDSREIDREFVDRQVFDAEYFVPATGTGSVPALTTGVPLTVRYVSATENVLLYTYDATTANFTAVAPTTGRASLTYSPSNKSGTFDVAFSGEEGACVQVLADGTMVAGAFVTAAPGVDDLPRLEFLHGSDRITSISRLGGVYAAAFLSGVVSELPAQFSIYGGSVVRSSWKASGMVGNFRALLPTDVSGLVLQLRADALTFPSETAFSLWPDGSGLGNDVSHSGPNPPGYSPELGNPVDATIPQFFSDTHLPVVAVALNKAGPPLITPVCTRLQTAGNVFDPSEHCFFMVVMPHQNYYQNLVYIPSPNDLLSAGAQVDGTPAENDYLFGLTSGRMVFGRYYTDAGATLNEAVATVAVYPSNAPAWVLVEQELNATHLIVKQDGVVRASTAVSGVRGTTDRYIAVGTRDPNTGIHGTGGYGLSGYVRVILVYEGVPTAHERTKIRNYLRRHYGPF